MVKLLTCSDGWSYHSNHKDEDACLSFIEQKGYDTRRCSIEYKNGLQIRVDQILELKETPTGSPTAWHD